MDHSHLADNLDSFDPETLDALLRMISGDSTAAGEQLLQEQQPAQIHAAPQQPREEPPTQVQSQVVLQPQRPLQQQLQPHQQPQPQVNPLQPPQPRAGPPQPQPPQPQVQARPPQPQQPQPQARPPQPQQPQPQARPPQPQQPQVQARPSQPQQPQPQARPPQPQQPQPQARPPQPQQPQVQARPPQPQQPQPQARPPQPQPQPQAWLQQPPLQPQQQPTSLQMMPQQPPSQLNTQQPQPHQQQHASALEQQSADSDWVLAELLNLFPDACPDAASALVRSTLQAQAQSRDVTLEQVVNHFLERGYTRRVKKYQRLRESAGSAGSSAASNSSGPGSQQPCADYWDLAGRPATSMMESRAVGQILGAEFPFISQQSLTSACAAHGHRLAPTYCFLHARLAQHGFTPTTPWSYVANGSEFVLTCAPPDQPQQQQQQQQQPQPAFRLQFLRNRRLKMYDSRASQELAKRPDLARELQAARERCRVNADSAANPPGDGQSGEAPPDDGALFECECCFGEFPFDSMTQCPVGHLFCRECLNGYVREKVYGSGTASFDCMADGCGLQFLPSLVRGALNQQVLAKFEERLQEENLRVGLNDPNFVRCPTCQWGAILDADARVFSCQNCELESCRHCGQDWAEHFGKKCSELEQKDETRMRRDYEEQMSRARLRECHQCHASVYKIDGCNHITCRCRAHFCYICRQPLPLKDPYGHFCNHPKDPKDKGCPNHCGKCFLYTDTKQDEDLAIKDLQEQARKRRREDGFDDDKLIGAPQSPKRAKH